MRVTFVPHSKKVRSSCCRCYQGPWPFKAFSSTSLADGQPLSSSPIFREQAVPGILADCCRCFPCQNHVTWLCWAGAWGCLLSRLCGRGGEEEEKGEGGEEFRGLMDQIPQDPPHRPASWSSLILSGQDKGWGNKGKRNWAQRILKS